jgi:hypothetical protein
MAQPPFPASTNLDGSNPGPNYAQLPDTVQMPTGKALRQLVSACYRLTLCL